MPEIVEYENPYPTPEPTPYHPDDPNLPDPVDAPLPPDLVHMTPDEAKANAAQQAAAVVQSLPEPEPTEPPMVTAYKASLPTSDCTLGT